MKKLITCTACLLVLCLHAQTTIWTENFGTGCNRGQTAAMYTGSNGAWTITNTGANDTYANTWYVSGTAAGTGVGMCNDNCNLNPAASNQSLHIAYPALLFPGVFNFGADTGSTYLTGVFCGFGYCSTAHKRAESPVINCTGYSNITISFNYYENGEGSVDDATLWYSSDGGTGWTQIDAIAKTSVACNPVLGGTWTAITPISLPASANNNPNVKIGFNWVNDANSAGTDPSFAVDDVVIQGISGGGPTISTGAVTGSPFCSGDSIAVPYTITGTFTGGNIFTAQLSDGAGSFASPTVIGSAASTTAGTIMCAIPAGSPTGSGYMVRVVSSTPAVIGSNSATFTINALPIATSSNTGPYCEGNTISLNASGGTDFDWAGPNSYNQPNTQNPTITSSTMAMAGVYTVTVTDANGCVSTSSTTVSIVDCSGIENEELNQSSVFPNPASDHFNISIHQNMVNNCMITVVNLLGETVYSMVPNQPVMHLSKTQLGLKTGIYLVKIKYLNSVKAIKVVVQ